MAEHLISIESSTTTDLIAINDDKNKNKMVLDSNTDNNNNGVVPQNKTKKKSVNILKVALMLLRRRSSKSNAAAVDVASKGMWKRFVGSMRPLHLQSNQSPEHDGVVVPPLLPLIEAPVVAVEVVAGLRASPSVENFEDVMSSPFSPHHVHQSSSCSDDGMSRYASAINLQELDQNDDNVEDENVDGKVEANLNGGDGDEMIDAKAEMFIAKFYEQMRLQRSDSDVRYHEMIKRSIG